MAAAICRPIRVGSTTLRRRGPTRASRSIACRRHLKRLYFDTIVYTHHQLEYLVEQYGADHVLVGTDYPADMGEIDPIGFVEGASGLDDNERRAILGGNAARLLNIEVPRRLA
jgi:aminocarboxymuconate-semialdehyde decarboxylase